MVSSRATALETSYGRYPCTNGHHQKRRRRRPRRRRSPRGNRFLELHENTTPANRNINMTPNKTCDHMMKLHTCEDPHQYVALDCEMVGVGVGPGGVRSVLARVSVISGDGTCLLDSFVRVQEKVTDFRSWVSGVNPGDLSGPHVLDFGVARNKVQTLLQGKILVGHGLQNDLKALASTHPWHQTRDTALYEPFLRFDPYSGQLRSQKLRDLTKQRLGRTIQEEGVAHDSCVDAQAALDLYMSEKNDWECALEHSMLSMARKYPSPGELSIYMMGSMALHYYPSPRAHYCRRYS